MNTFPGHDIVVSILSKTIGRVLIIPIILPKLTLVGLSWIFKKIEDIYIGLLILLSFTWPFIAIYLLWRL